MNNEETSNAIVLQHYKITTGRHELSTIEMRIMALVIFKLKDAQIGNYENNGDIDVEVLNSYATMSINNAEITVGKNHSQVKQALQDLRSRNITLRTLVNGKEGELYTGLIEKAGYSDDASTININLSPELLPELVKIGKCYTSYGLDFLFKTKSAHAIRWYQIGSHWLNKGVFFMSKEEIRELFSAQGKYEQHVNFHRLLVTKPFKEVNDKSDIALRVTKTHKKGRNIVGYTISVTKKESATETIETDVHQWVSEYGKEYWTGVLKACKKANYDAVVMRESIKKRGVEGGKFNNERHYKNATTKWISEILATDGNSEFTAVQYADLISQRELNI